MNNPLFGHGDGRTFTRTGGKPKASTAESGAGASAAGGDKTTSSTSSRTRGGRGDGDGASGSSESEAEDTPPHVIVTSKMLAESEEKNAKSLQEIVDERVVALRETDKLDPSEVVVVVTPEMQVAAKKSARRTRNGEVKMRGEGKTWKQLEKHETDYLIQDQLESLIKEEARRLRAEEVWRLREEALKTELAARDAAGMLLLLLLLLLGVCYGALRQIHKKRCSVAVSASIHWWK
jgi:hypothetical protein